MDCRTALLTLLDQVDYCAGNCGFNEPVGAVLPVQIIELCREAVRNTADVQDVLVRSKQVLLQINKWLGENPDFDLHYEPPWYKEFREVVQNLDAASRAASGQPDDDLGLGGLWAWEPLE